MSAIEKDVILIHTGTNASIPSNWTRETSLDGIFPKGWDDSNAPNITGGNATHTHTSPTHIHTIASHTHTMTTNTVNGSSGCKSVASDQMFRGNHYHTGATGAVSSGGATSATAVTYGSVSNDPPNRRVIFIKAGAGAQLLDDIVALWGDSDTAPTNWSKVTELAGRYLKGASAGADSDLATDNGSYTNLHDITHTHSSVSNHAHATGTTGGVAGIDGYGESTVNASYHLVAVHTHTFDVNTATTNINSNTDTLTTLETVEPLYRRLHAIRKGSGGLKEKKIIGLFLGDPAHPPRGWSLYTAMKGYHLKIGDPTTSATGGSNAHTHTAQGHVHTGTSHTHTGSSISSFSSTLVQTGSYNASGSLDITTHVHTFSSITTDATNYSSSNTTADSSNNEPQFRTVAFIQFQHGGFSPLTMGQL